MSWSNNYVGAPYAKNDCWDLVSCVLHNEFFIDMALQRFVPVYDSAAEADTFQSQYERFSEYWTEIDTPAEGDLVVFSEHKHIGIMVSGTAFLHTTQRTDAVVEQLFTTDNFWSNRVAGYYRHNSRLGAGDSLPLALSGRQD
jgi:hypothetical protein